MNEEQNSRAACLSINTDLFFPPAADVIGVREAKNVCATCPTDVREACLNVALKDWRLGGIWGGTTENERRKIRRLAGVEKDCRRCGDTFSLLDFPKNSRAVDGHHSWCKVCWREYNAERRGAA